jgi:hypothetical protein
MSDYELDFSGTAFSTDDGIHDGLTPKPYRKPNRSPEQELMDTHPGMTLEEAARTIDLWDELDRERKAKRWEHY